MEKEFISKQNQVILLSEKDNVLSLKEYPEVEMVSSMIKKEFRDSEKYKKEVFIGDILRSTSGILTPKRVLCEEPNIIYYEYIKGLTAIDFLESLEKKGDLETSYKVVDAIADWLKTFYIHMECYTGDKWILGDIHLRNFIVTHEDKGFQRIYGIDFEDCKRGCWEQDIARLCAFIITYTPSFTEFKLKIAKKFIILIREKLILNQEDLRKNLMKELKSIEKRRAMKMFYHLVEDII